MLYNESLVSEINHDIEDLARLEEELRRAAPNARERTQKAIARKEQGIANNFKLDSHIREEFRRCYRVCEMLGHHQSQHFYDHAFIEFIEGNAAQAAEIAEKYLICSQENNECMTSAELLLIGQAYIELAQFHKAIEALSEAIEKDSSNKEAYFHRATAYFETGHFDQALHDYLSSNHAETIQKSVFVASVDFTQSLISGLGRGIHESVTDFFPSLCSSAYGIGEALWVTAQHPIESTANFASTCYETAKSIVDNCKQMNWETIDGYAYEFRSFCDNFEQLSEFEKGNALGYIIGRYGTDIFAGEMAVRGMSAYRNLKNANKLCNLEAMAMSDANKGVLVASANTHAAEREAFFKNVKLHTDSQNKHIPGKHNYEPDKYRSIFIHSDPEKLLKEFAGTGIPKNNATPGIVGYVERVNFGELIGYYIDEKNPTIQLPTNKGTIKYSKKGAHIYYDTRIQIMSIDTTCSLRQGYAKFEASQFYNI